MTSPSPDLSRLRRFVGEFAGLLDEAGGLSEAALLDRGGRLLGELVEVDDWLPEAYAQPHPEHYQQYLLHADSRERFSVVSFVWGPGQRTPIHDHTVWGLIGVLRGAERAQPFRRDEAGRLVASGDEQWLRSGAVDAVSPSIGDIHQVSNAFDDRTSISIHVYGANIGAVARSVYQPDGTRKPFVSGYGNTELPNIWDRSAEVRAKAT